MLAAQHHRLARAWITRIGTALQSPNNTSIGIPLIVERLLAIHDDARHTHSTVPNARPISAVTAIASAPQKTTRIVARTAGDPPPGSHCAE